MPKNAKSSSKKTTAQSTRAKKSSKAKAPTIGTKKEVEYLLRNVTLDAISDDFTQRCGAFNQYFSGISQQEQLQLTLNDIPVMRFAEAIAQLVEKSRARTLLDYGARHGLHYKLRDFRLPSNKQTKSLAQLWQPASVTSFEPATFPAPTHFPNKFDGVFAVNVFERYPASDIPRMLDEAFSAANKFAYITVECFDNHETLPDGSSFNQTVRSADWWKSMISAAAAKHPDVQAIGSLSYFADEDSSKIVTEAVRF